MITIRSNIFETNSSSTHTISISKEEVYNRLSDIARDIANYQYSLYELGKDQAKLYGYLAEMESDGVNYLNREEGDDYDY